MPWHPLKRCSYPGCRNRVKSGRCPEHRQEANTSRGTRTERGYSNRWGKYRLMYLKAHPLCVECAKRGIHTPATIVDHIIPIDGERDVLFWPASNHQGLCHSCHSRKTTTQDPLTKQQRRAGQFRALEVQAAETGWGEV
ncbi:MAG: HNH endonuclease signature motif containing protein [Serratia marcescens]|uniref:HNH endonuclease n=1 Tax=Serratia marcescens TaxID=615 RepID=UPI000EFA3839|nr:HNH endonuclease signature motif containing protein [Serratia marcescens]MDU7803449.1 HNH endonuclease signature motif containing protein [Serratia marcescens]RLO39181.1 HNH endonuclease [Serratia marcescens]BCZ43668.1 HNH endonuclease [Serratia marcescens]HBI6268858.1 HNH endonuclease [Serratia marcescens]HBI6949482.1 HNH endonuclease [Serratia marcescens]